MKASKYNVYINEGECFYVYNQLTGSLTQVDEQLFKSLKGGGTQTSENKFPVELMGELIRSNFICEDELIEENMTLRMNRQLRYGNQHARVTILPCNFKCWYCYESHVESQINKEIVEATLLFIEQIIVNKKIKTFHLDWFESEPLLYFHEVMYVTIGLKVKELCNKMMLILLLQMAI